MNPELVERLRELPTFLGGHLSLSLSALAVGLAVSLPLGIALARRPRLAELARGAAGVIQTVPSLALLALLVPLVGIGFVPAFFALTLYSILPILVTTVVGLREVNPVMIEAARGLGMSDAQMLWRVQLPLAAPVIFTGIRTATVLVVGTATLAMPVGEATLGNYIFVGLQTLDYFSIVFGCVFAALLAVLLDQLVRLLELAFRRRSRLCFALAVAGLLLAAAGGLYRPLSRLLSPSTQPVVVGSATFTEQHVLSEVFKEHLQGHGFAVEQRRGMGKMIMFEALRRNQIDCCVDYTGSLWAVVLKQRTVERPDKVYEQVKSSLREKYGIECLGRLGFDNAFALAMGEATAKHWGVERIGDLVKRAPDWTIAGDEQFFSRPEWVHVRDRYGLNFREIKPMDPSLMYQSVAGDSVMVICAYTTDGRLDAYHLKVLEDDRAAFLPYDAVILVSPQAVHKPGLVETLSLLIEEGGVKEEKVAAMRQANRRVDLEKQRIRQAALELLPTLLGSPAAP
jgi:osmoprotectant transport system permease protein